ncbi:hypothetical protein HYN59_15495 [Flavobacterium album]|uniref:Uncharacterized protein n=1 Tax=Flavobacterium album TaxID=2175091 RepID=A0A2S1R1B1_9FLAO|nr:hypothetical protein [Flavobacterium album]AWH86424.1 hypothetical protein HYN59_15495 [Flavobacterium album]
MKRILTIAAFSILSLSCETEERAINLAPENNILSNAALAGKLRRVTQSPSAIDDFIDGTSCFAIAFPYSVVANGETVNLASEAGYQQVRDILEASATGTDEVTINFPVNVVYADYTEAAFNDQTEFDAAVGSCTGYVELSCMDLVYPLEINTYNSQNQLAESFDLGNKRALFEILNDVTYDGLAFDYPIHFNAPDGTVLTLIDNNALEAAIDSYTDECLALLNPEPNPNPLPGDVLVQGSWYVSYYFSFTDQTITYGYYDFIFNANGTITISGGSPVSGTWAVSGSNTEMQLAFDGSGLEALQGIWTITNVTQTLIKMHRDATGVDPEKFLSLHKN